MFVQISGCQIRHRPVFQGISLVGRGNQEIGHGSAGRCVRRQSIMNDLHAIGYREIDYRTDSVKPLRVASVDGVHLSSRLTSPLVMDPIRFVD
ncbi:MAG: hypothetical protein AB7P17_06770 [Nitrospirales bacterium]